MCPAIWKLFDEPVQAEPMEVTEEGVRELENLIEITPQPNEAKPATTQEEEENLASRRKNMREQSENKPGIPYVPQAPPRANNKSILMKTQPQRLIVMLKFPKPKNKLNRAEKAKIHFVETIRKAQSVRSTPNQPATEPITTPPPWTQPTLS